jgi:hypothetical protein
LGKPKEERPKIEVPQSIGLCASVSFSDSISLSESAEISPTVSEDFFITDFHLSDPQSIPDYRRSMERSKSVQNKLKAKLERSSSLTEPPKMFNYVYYVMKAMTEGQTNVLRYLLELARRRLGLLISEFWTCQW